MSYATNLKIIEDALIIDEADNSQEELINNNKESDTPNTHGEYESIIFQEVSLLKHYVSGSECPKSLDRMKRAAGFSR